MKEIVKVIEVDGEGLEAFLGKRITLFCDTYIYTGDLVGVNGNFVKLENAQLVYETGPLTSGLWKDAQQLPTPWYVFSSKVESFGIMK